MLFESLEMIVVGDWKPMEMTQLHALALTPLVYS
jgi:hypothetical protein